MRKVLREGSTGGYRFVIVSDGFARLEVCATVCTFMYFHSCCSIVRRGTV